MGLFQVMGFHFEADENPYDAQTNAQRALLLMGELLAEAHGDLGLAFAGYNGGAGMMYSPPDQWPAETQVYQYWAGGIYEEAELGFEESPTLLDWLDAGGRTLCQFDNSP